MVFRRFSTSVYYTGTECKQQRGKSGNEANTYTYVFY